MELAMPETIANLSSFFLSFRQGAQKLENRAGGYKNLSQPDGISYHFEMMGCSQRWRLSARRSMKREERQKSL